MTRMKLAHGERHQDHTEGLSETLGVAQSFSTMFGGRNTMKVSQLTGLILAGTLATACRTATPVPPSKFPYVDDVSLRGFAEEVLFGYGTQRTHEFYDTKGSYHVSPDELVKELPGAAALYGLDLQAVVVVGSYGPLWAYDVISLIHTPECVRVNWLLMPHARITAKRSGCVPFEFAAEWLEEVRTIAALEGKRAAGKDEPCVLLAEDAGQTFHERYSSFGCYAEENGAAFDALDRAYERLSSRLELTYSGYPPAVESQ